jgi:D-glycero-alpha-D-manno-heptose-7-phosphate kinase
MIIVRAPLRISFVGGGTDLPGFYQQHPGKVISAAIDKYVYVAINPAPLIKGITARYSITETVNQVSLLKNDRIREVMLDLQISDNMEIGVFSQLPVGTGLGGSSAFTAALFKGLSTSIGKRLDKKEIAENACRVEIDLLKEPIGKQDQYASAMGGFNIFQFNPDETVEVEPVLLDFKKQMDLEKHMLLFFTGITRQASSVLNEQKTNISSKFETLKSMTLLVDTFKKELLKGNFEALGELLHKNWLKKKQLASKVSNQVIDKLYDTGIRNGAWGGKILGAGGGGCILFLVPFNKKESIRSAMKRIAVKYRLEDFNEIPVKFVQSGVEVISNSLLK